MRNQTKPKDLTGATGLLPLQSTLCTVLGKKFVDEVWKMFNGGRSFSKKKKKGKKK